MHRLGLWVESLEARQLFAGLSTEVVVGGSGSLTVNASQALSDGSYVIAGTFSGKIDFQPKGGTQAAAVGSDGFVARYSVKNKLLWVDTFVGGGTQSITAISIDPRNNDIVYAGVATDSTLVPVGNGLQTIIPQGNQDMLIGRLTSAGRGMRAAMIGGADATITPASIDVNSDGAFVLGGTMRGTIDFSTGVDAFPISAPSHQTAGFVAVYQPKNSLQWVDPLSVKKSNNAVVAAQWDGSGNVYVLGNVKGLAKLGASSTGHTSAGQSGLMAELDGTGKKIFFDLLDGGNSVIASDLLVSGSNVVVAGAFNLTADIEMTPGGDKFLLVQPIKDASGSSFIADYSTDGTLQTAVALGASSFLTAQRLVPVSNSAFGVVGVFRGTGNLDPAASTFAIQSKKKKVAGKKKLTTDVFFGEYNFSLQFVTGSQYGSTANEQLTAASYNPVKKIVSAAILPNAAADGIDSEIDLAVLV